MKYKVSLLPEINRKRLNSKKKIERIKVYALIVLVVLLAFLIVVVGTKLYADKQLSKMQQLNNEYAQKVAELQHFRDINANLQQKVNLIESIQVEEPQLYNFVATISNLEHPGVSITSIECTDWKTARNCVLMGTADSRKAYLAFEESLSKIEGVASVANVTYLAGVEESSEGAQFTININCSGGAAVIVTTEAPTETTAAAE